MNRPFPQIRRRRARALLVPLILSVGLIASVVAAPAEHAVAATPVERAASAGPDAAQLLAGADAGPGVTSDDSQVVFLAWSGKGPHIGSVLLSAGRFRKCINISESVDVTLVTGTYEATSYRRSNCRSDSAFPASSGQLKVTSRNTTFTVSAIAPPSPIAT